MGATPGLPLPTTVTPAARPCKASETDTAGNSPKDLAVTVETAPVTSTRLWVPYPVTTKSFNVEFDN